MVSPIVEEPIQTSMKDVEDLPKEEATVMHEPVVKKKKEVDAKDWYDVFLNAHAIAS